MLSEPREFTRALTRVVVPLRVTTENGKDLTHSKLGGCLRDLCGREIAARQDDVVGEVDKLHLRNRRILEQPTVWTRSCRRRDPHGFDEDRAPDGGFVPGMFRR
ncbi:hypothetical protein GCM10025780_29400 [Frondihabitans cladoniiphilus]|uniref:Uncharacterized protein n=1 Tax=Frondihabitans cladoniiphilus TaxID=715785 RepID=A0ABP8W6J1_9MICO